MNRNDIRAVYTAEVARLINSGWQIFPETMSGTQGELAHTDFTRDGKIRRLLMERHYCDAGHKITITEGLADFTADQVNCFEGYYHSIWNDRLTVIWQSSWLELADNYFVDFDEAAEIERIRLARYRAKPRANTHTELDGKYRDIAVKFIKRKTGKTRLGGKVKIERYQSGRYLIEYGNAHWFLK